MYYIYTHTYYVFTYIPPACVCRCKVHKRGVRVVFETIVCERGCPHIRMCVMLSCVYEYLIQKQSHTLTHALTHKISRSPVLERSHHAHALTRRQHRHRQTRCTAPAPALTAADTRHRNRHLFWRGNPGFGGAASLALLEQIVLQISTGTILVEDDERLLDCEKEGEQEK